MDQIELAKKIAFEKHNGQFRRDGVTPYINHPAEVVRLLEKSNASAHEIAAGWLHDVIEDTGTTLEELTNLGGFRGCFIHCWLLNTPPARVL